MRHLRLFEDFLTEGKRKPIDPEAFVRSDIAKLFGEPEEVSFSKDSVRVKALLWIYKYQTEEEKRTDSTHVINGVGFTGTDAEILSSFAKQVINRHFLSEKQMVILRKKIKKYENQMAKIATHIKKEGGKKDEKIDDVMKLWAKENFKKYSQTKMEFPSVKEAVEYVSNDTLLESFTTEVVEDLTPDEKRDLEKILNVSRLENENEISFVGGSYTVKLFRGKLGISVSVEPGERGNIDDAERLENRLNREIAETFPN